MGTVTDFKRAKETREQRQVYDRDPDLYLEAWLNDQGEIIATQVKGTWRAPSETGQQAHDLVDNLLGMASQGASIMGEEHWQAEPVYTTHLLRGGFMMTRARRFWHSEGQQPLAKRLRCARWILVSSWDALSAVLGATVRLVFRPETFPHPEDEED